jgi:RNA polymerase sigma-70 factor (ECF subfamily)
VVGRPLDESELIERAKRGDGDAYEALLRLHQDAAFRTAYVIAGSAADAEEVTQDAFLKAYRALGRFRRGSPFRPWLLSIVANEARNRRRGAGRREHLATRAAAALPPAEDVPSPELAAVAADDRRELLAAIARLRDEDRVAILGRYFLGLTDAEAAAVLGVRTGAVKTRVWRALERLRAELGERDG